MATPQTGAGDPKRSLELLWREFEPQSSRPGPKPRLTIEQIAEAAVALADRDGIAAVNMRDVAAELGVGTMTLYRYVPGKGELLDLMVDIVSDPKEDAARAAGMGWREVLEYVADSTLEFYQAHPWMLEINQRRPVLGPGSLAGYELALTAFERHTIPNREANLIVTAIWSIVTGTALSYMVSDTPAEQGGPVSTEEEWWEAQLPYLERAVASGRFPALGRVQDENAWEIQAQEAMRYALDTFLDGIAARMEASRVERPKTT
ncbi:TetR/AcrR family transcriptional regulator [Glycomyces sp. NRRL B-16210]|uniref:TetR/AcrR family transcriptional regulator n=1 Tax=Glycomyces sp. NRRL B-16210 TaxID=1463821 RepID=UPI000555FB9B|nr:TetR/AcrR family transcriptional regulator [Glycomyces sp. NRRL B-16210]